MKENLNVILKFIGLTVYGYDGRIEFHNTKTGEYDETELSPIEEYLECLGYSKQTVEIVSRDYYRAIHHFVSTGNQIKVVSSYTVKF